MPLTIIERRIMKSLAKHGTKTFPTLESVQAKGRWLTERQVIAAKAANPAIARAWRDKIIEVAKSRTLSELCDTRVIPQFSGVPEILAHRRKLMLARIATFQGRPSFAGLAEHITGDSNKISAVSKDPIVRTAAEARLIALLKKMTIVEIIDQRLDRKASKEVQKYVDERKKREGVEKKRQTW
ncbi:MAG: hypothetical protein Q8R15_04485 [Candidatus Micrarchaeota archaeon]|nr:hypothetical protein [Candidatus Micrarchaeota archaeon]